MIWLSFLSGLRLCIDSLLNRPNRGICCIILIALSRRLAADLVLLLGPESDAPDTSRLCSCAPLPSAPASLLVAVVIIMIEHGLLQLSTMAGCAGSVTASHHGSYRAPGAVLPSGGDDATGGDCDGDRRRPGPAGGVGDGPLPLPLPPPLS